MLTSSPKKNSQETSYLNRIRVDFGDFAVYRTADINLTQIINVLGKRVFGDKKQFDLWAPISTSFLGQEPPKLIKYHRSVAGPEGLNKSLFVVADRADQETEGLLIVNLNFKGYVDAIRLEANVAGDDVPPMNIGNTTWHENLCNGNRPRFPRKAFAAYSLGSSRAKSATRRSEDGLRDLQNLLGAGLNGRKANSDMSGGVCVVEKLGLRYLDDVRRYQRDASEEKGYNLEIFVVVDASAWDSRNVLPFGVGTEDHGLRINTYMVTEILQWLYVWLIFEDSVQCGKDMAKLEEIGLLSTNDSEPRD